MPDEKGQLTATEIANLSANIEAYRRGEQIPGWVPDPNLDYIDLEIVKGETFLNVDTLDQLNRARCQSGLEAIQPQPTRAEVNDAAMTELDEALDGAAREQSFTGQGLDRKEYKNAVCEGRRIDFESAHGLSGRIKQHDKAVLDRALDETARRR